MEWLYILITAAYFFLLKKMSDILSNLIELATCMKMMAELQEKIVDIVKEMKDKK